MIGTSSAMVAMLAPTAKDEISHHRLSGISIAAGKADTCPRRGESPCQSSRLLFTAAATCRTRDLPVQAVPPTGTTRPLRRSAPRTSLLWAGPVVSNAMARTSPRDNCAGGRARWRSVPVPHRGWHPAARHCRGRCGKPGEAPRSSPNAGATPTDAANATPRLSSSRRLTGVVTAGPA